MKQFMVRSEDREEYIIVSRYRLYSLKEDDELLKKEEPVFLKHINRDNKGYLYILGFRAFSVLRYDGNIDK